jgi:hypothetical protein
LCPGILQPLLGALPHLQHLHLPLVSLYSISPEATGMAAVAALGPLQHSTTLTSLVLGGPLSRHKIFTDEVYAQVLAGLPPTLRSLDWRDIDLHDPRGLSFDHLTGLTRLSLNTWDWNGLGADIPGDAFTALTQLRRLELYGVNMSDQGLLPHKERLVGLGLGRRDLTDASNVLPQLTHLQALVLTACKHVEDLLPQAPDLRELKVFLQWEDSEEWRELNREWDDSRRRRRRRRGRRRKERMETTPAVHGPAIGACSSTRGSAGWRSWMWSMGASGSGNSHCVGPWGCAPSRSSSSSASASAAPQRPGHGCPGRVRWRGWSTWRC